MPDISVWVFVMVALVLAILMLSLRLTILELVRVKLDFLQKQPSRRGFRVRISAVNLSYKNLEDITVEIEAVCREDGTIIDEIDCPLVLQTKQSIDERIVKTGDQNKLVPNSGRHRFSISGKQNKTIEVIEIDNVNHRFVIPHELGEYPIPNGSYTFIIICFGAGVPARYELKTKVTPAGVDVAGTSFR
jgi:hypothetical protein